MSHRTVTEQRFYIVWSPTGQHPPQFRHADLGSALSECHRLALANPGRDFYAMEMVGGANANGLVEKRVKIDWPIPKMDEPFWRPTYEQSPFQSFAEATRLHSQEDYLGPF